MDYQPFRKKLRFINKENLHESISELSLYIMTDPKIAGMQETIIVMNNPVDSNAHPNHNGDEKNLQYYVQ